MEMKMKSMSTNRLLLMAALHFVIMYALMYAMVNSFNNVIPNLNNAYMAGLMTSPMLILEAILMGSMYENKRAVRIIMVASAVALILFFLFIRQQTFIGDRELVRSMIPHHAGAILMCEQATLDDSETLALCENIIEAQVSEIAQMKAILDRLD